ncbi:MAG TPA: phage baseplate assembly protein V [Chthoniobacter sp.]|nr:phage baseplate assembly protein V [Chthoniobacter sp.]
MNLGEMLSGKAEAHARTNRIYGVVSGIVTNNHDPEGRARVKVHFPWMSDHAESDWAKLVTFMGGRQRGAVFLPEPGDEVLVAFEHGDLQHPYILGALWNADDPPPETNQDGKNHLRVIKSRSGHEIILNDTPGAEKIEIRDQSGQNVISIDTAKGELTLSSQTKLILRSQQIEIEASSTLKVSASAALELKGATVKIN